jgi:drug/metabolite transporter superfamily protein YnfA
MTLLALLVLAAVLEIGGDAAIRHGLLQSAWRWVMLGGTALLAYGLVVNANRAVAFGRLMGLYIVVFFVVSQVLSLVLFAERPPASLALGGLFIVLGGLVIHFGGR